MFAATAAYAAVLVVFVSGDIGGARQAQCLVQLEGGIFKMVQCPGKLWEGMCLLFFVMCRWAYCPRLKRPNRGAGFLYEDGGLGLVLRVRRAGYRLNVLSDCLPIMREKTMNQQSTPKNDSNTSHIPSAQSPKTVNIYCHSLYWYQNHVISSSAAVFTTALRLPHLRRPWPHPLI